MSMTEGFEHYRLISIPSLHLEIVERHHQMVQLLSGTGGPSVGLVPVALLDPVGLVGLVDLARLAYLVGTVCLVV